MIPFSEYNKKKVHGLKKKKELEKRKEISVANGNYFLFFGKKYKIIISDSDFSDVKLEQNKIKIFCSKNEAKKSFNNVVKSSS